MYTLSMVIIESVLKIKYVDNDDFRIHDSAMSSHHQTIDPYVVSVDTKFISYCNLISTVREHYSEVLEFMMNNKSMVQVIHDVTFNMHSTTKHDSVNIPITRTIPSCVTAKPPPHDRRKVSRHWKGRKNFPLHFVLWGNEHTTCWSCTQ